MSPARDGVRERGMWNGAAALVVAVVIASANFGGAAAGSTPTPRPAVPAPTAVPGFSSPHRLWRRLHHKLTVADMIRDRFGIRAEQALRVARCESDFNPHELSSAGAEGIFQIMPAHSWRIGKVGGSDLYDPGTNVRVAFDLYKDEGWRPWVCAHRLGIA